MPEPGDKNRPKGITEYHKIEIHEIFARTQAYAGLRFQLFSFMGTAHLTIIGIAFTVQKVILIYIAAGLMVLLMRIDAVIEALIEAMVVRGLQLELMYSSDDEPTWASIISAVSEKKIEPRALTMNLREATTPADIVRRIRGRRTQRLGVWLPVSVLLLESVGGLLLWGFGVLPLW